MPADQFRVICEIEPPTRPDLTHARHQIGVLTPVSDTFLIPDNHIGRATVSSIAVAFRRDLLTAAAYGVEQFLFVHGDKPVIGQRTGELTVRAMLDEARQATTRTSFEGVDAFRLGVTAGHRNTLPAWKKEADFVFVQVSYSAAAFLRWRDHNPTELPVYAGVMVLASPAMARRLRSTIPDIDIPDDLVSRVADDPDAGVDAACQLVAELEQSGAFAGVHLIPVNRYRSIAARLEPA